jgi:hypothetical protein
MRFVSPLKWVAASALRIFFGAAIATGIIRQLAPFPYRAISYWQAKIQAASINFPGSEIFFWFSNHWLELSVAIGLIQLSRLTWALNRAE